MSTFCGVKMTVPSTQDSNLKKPPARDLYTELRPLWWILLIFLTAPIQRDKSGRIISSWLTWSGIFTLGLCAFNWWMAYNIFHVHVQTLKDSETFQAGVFASSFILGLSLHVMIPLTTWPFAKKLAIYFNDWTDFQDHYAEVCGRQLEFHLYDLSRCLACFCLLTLPLTVVQFSIVSSAPVWHVYAYFPATVHARAVTCAWHCNCEALGSAAEKMADDFAIAVTSRASLTEHLREYRKLWNSLQKLSTALSSCQSATILQATLFVMTLNLINAFGVLGAIVTGESLNKVSVMLMMAAFSHMELFFLASAGYKCAEKMNMKMKMYVLRLPYSRSLVEEHEVNLFFKDMSTRPACVRIVGYVNIDRLLYVKIVAALARNFLVLLQFAYTGAKNSARPTETPRDDSYDFLR